MLNPLSTGLNNVITDHDTIVKIVKHYIWLNHSHLNTSDYDFLTDFVIKGSLAYFEDSGLYPGDDVLAAIVAGIAPFISDSI